ncbi:c-type cytochrome, partial [Burkholderia cenocepacia]|uniref:c-type cytochrome n=1 Tax=Burkholderia cenocepacia TaxID=95486 RepID=UPI0034E0B294
MAARAGQLVADVLARELGRVQEDLLAERLQGCFRYSMNGKAPPAGDPILVALETYSYWLAK